jgi:POT family proton-dependent oligopeptide transporter
MNNIVVLVGLAIAAVMCIPVFSQMRKHPQGLHILFFAEMWERFSYYGMRGLLIVYFTQHFLFDDRFAQAQYGAYTTMVYLLPLVGGFIADRYLGTRKSIAFGALLLVAGHLLMGVEQEQVREVLTYDGVRYEVALEGRLDQRTAQVIVDGARYDWSVGKDATLTIVGLPEGASLPRVLAADTYEWTQEGRDPVYVGIMMLALSLIVMGVGFLKANISTIVGQLYDNRPDGERDAGFFLYYFGINLGAFLAGIFCGLVGVTYGWWAGFGLAGVGMLFGWLVFVRGRLAFFLPGPNQLPEHVGRPPEGVDLKAKALGPLSLENTIYVLGLIGVFAVWGLMTLDVQARAAISGAAAAHVLANGEGAPLPFGLQIADFFAVIGAVLAVGSVVVLTYIFRVMARDCNPVERGRMTLALVLIAASVVFWTLFEQAGSSLNQFAERSTQYFDDPNPNDWLDVSMTSGQTQAFNSFFILLLAPVFAALWTWLDKRKSDLNDVLKFAIALILAGVGFLVLVVGAQYADADYRVPLIFLAGLYLFHTLGELFLSPVGLSAITKLSVAKVVSTMMAVWFLSSAWAQWLGAVVAGMTAQETVGGVVTDPGRALATYVEVFWWLAGVAIGLGVLFALVSPWLNRLRGPSARQ